MSLPASEILAQSWTSAAPGYDELFVPRFEPWTAEALAVLKLHAAALPAGPVLIPCCGPGQELPLVAEVLGERHPVLGTDIAPGMIAIAQKRAEACGPHVSAAVGDAMVPPPGPHSAMLSVFGLQQLPDPAAAIGAWVGALAPGGVAVVVFWPMGSGVESDGPWAHWGSILKSKLGDSAKRGPDGWEGALVGSAEAAGAEVLKDKIIPHEIVWGSPALMWEGMTHSGPWHAQRLRRGDEFVDGLREAFVSAYPPDQPITHHPNARLLVLRRRPAAEL
jgi:SAM-dependent methyltransferase